MYIRKRACREGSIPPRFGPAADRNLVIESGGNSGYCTDELSSSSGAPCLRNNCGRFCENAERGNTMSQPTSCAFCFRSPCTCDRNPIMDVPFLSLLFSLGIKVNGFTPL